MRNVFMLMCVILMTAVSLSITSCKAQRVITSESQTAITHDAQGRADSVTTKFTLKEVYTGVQRK